MMAAATARSAHTVDSMPTEKPDRIVVAAPVLEAFAISWTGARVVSVKCCVRTWMTAERARPMRTAKNMRTLCAYQCATAITATADSTAETKNPRLIARIPCSFSDRGATM